MKAATATNLLHQLEEEHHTLDAELKTLTRRAYLTPGEQRQAVELKKKKLSAKDALYALRSELTGDL